MSKIIKLSKLLTEILKEAGDLKNIQVIPYNKISDDLYEFSYNGMDVKVEFESHPSDIITDTIIPNVNDEVFQQVISKRADNINGYNVSFSVNDTDTQAKKTDIRTLFVILNTVVSIIKEFIREKKPFLLTVFSMSKFGSMSTDKQKSMLYAAISNQHLPSDYYLRDISIDHTSPVLDFFKGFKGLILFLKK
jgi:hypothetical protein